MILVEAKMELNKLYDIATKENIDIIDFKMKNKAIRKQGQQKNCESFLISG